MYSFFETVGGQNAIETGLAQMKALNRNIEKLTATIEKQAEKRYMLISVGDREILTEIFPTKLEAQEQMHREMIQYGNVPEDFFNSAEENELPCEYAYGPDCAYSNGGHQELDWLIVEI